MMYVYIICFFFLVVCKWFVQQSMYFIIAFFVAFFSFVVSLLYIH